MSATIRIRSPALASNRSRSLAWASGGKNLAFEPAKASASTLSQTRPLAPKVLAYSVRPSRSLRLYASPPPGTQIPRIRWPSRGGVLEDLELGLGGDVGDVLQLHPVAEVGPVVAEPLHRLGVVEPGQGEGQGLAGELLRQGGDEVLHRADDVLVLDERHLDVELGELGLAGGAEVLVAEAAGDLEVAVEPGDHQHLLVELRRLRQGVEVARVDPAGDEEVAGAFGGAPAQDRASRLRGSRGPTSCCASTASSCGGG